MVNKETFPSQQPGEKIIAVLHRHWFTFILQFMTGLVLLAVPIAVALVWRSFTHWQLEEGSLGFILLVMSASLYYLFVWNLLYNFWLDFSLDYYVISNLRVVDVDQSGLFSRTVAEQSIDRVQDCTSEMKGFFPTLMKFGSVYVQTAGQKERFVFEDVPNPEEVVRIIFQYSELQQQAQPKPPVKT